MLRLKSIVAVARAKRELMRQEWRAAGQKLHDIEVCGEPVAAGFDSPCQSVAVASAWTGAALSQDGCS